MKTPATALCLLALGLGSVFAGGACSGSGEDAAAGEPGVPSVGDDASAGPDAAVPIGASCKDDSSCNGGKCALGKCVAKTATNGTKDADETDVDCGGAVSPKCADGKACVAGGDCTSKVCTGGACAAPSPTDKVQNGDETDVDCGGDSPTAAKCIATRKCLKGSDCATGACPAGACSEARSCALKAGGATCGAGEVGSPDAKHEDCCASAVVPRPAASGGPFKLDKYLVTAGRMRAFLEAVSYDVRGFIAANRPTWWTGTGTSTWDAMLPTNKDEFLHFMTDGGSGCYIGAAAGQNGAPAYFAPATELANVVGGAPRTYTQEELDTKVMNCFRAPLFHALCAYDGGRLPSRAEWTAARTKDGVVLAYPWGANGTDADRKTRADYNFSYAWPRQPTAADHDLGGYLPAPGRFPLGNGPFGHADLLGSVENMGSQPAAGGGGGVTGDGWFQFSFQEPEIAAHPYAQQSVGFGSGAYRNHWAVGARCVKVP